MTVTVRPAVAADDAPLLAIDKATWTSVVSPAPLSDDRATFFEEARGPDHYLVAEVDGVVSGYVAMHQNIPLPSHKHVLEINGLAVDPASQGKGVGRHLVEAAVVEAAARGARKVTLRVLGGNVSARRLYERCGFTIEGVLRGEFILSGEEVDDILMAKHLD
jgi:ribosomal protein S18 acetylase RimI-like enzyme